MKHMAISKWLTQLDLREYLRLFDEEYDGVEDLLGLTELDLQQLGVHNRVHRVHMLSSIRVLQERERAVELRMMSQGRFASLPRNVHTDRQCSLASSMDLLSSRPPVLDVEPRFRGVSIHGTLPRKKKGSSPAWPLDTRGHTGTLPARSRLRSPQLVHNVIVEHGPPPADMEYPHINRDWQILDPTMDYVKFSRDKYIMEGPPEKLRKELEEELKQASEEPRSHAWYHGAIPRQVAETLLQRDGDFLIRDSVSSPGNYVLTCQWKNSPQHFKINKKMVAASEAYSRVQYLFESEGFDSVPALVRYYVGNRKPVSAVVGAIIFQPINRVLPLRCLEEKYGAAPIRQEPAAMERKCLPTKRLSLNITNGHGQDHPLTRGNLLRNKDKCGSQPACLNHVQERRRPLKTHQSESFLPLGCKPQSQTQSHLMDSHSSPKSPVFRTGSEPVLSPTVPRKPCFEMHAGQAIRGSDSQLYPKPPPKPSKVPSTKIPRSPRLHPIAPPAPPKKPQKPPAQLNPEPGACEPGSSTVAEWDRTTEMHPGDGYVKRLRADEANQRCPVTPEASLSCGSVNRSSYHRAIEALEDSNEEWSADRQHLDLLETKKEKEEQLMELKAKVFKRPVFETTSAFRPAEFETRLLPPENKPLEMSVLKQAKQLLVSQDHRTIAKTLLYADSQVARTLNVSEEMRCAMGVNSGLELATLPHGRQLRQDLMERHNTMCIGVAVDILGCTGTLEERAVTLNRIILVALELKDSMGDLYAFSAIMKALDMSQITRLDQTWTTLRRKYTHTAILYEKTLKPFYKGLYEGSVDVPLKTTTVPLLMPLLTLMERPAVAFEGFEHWENNDQGCEIMLRHLEEARKMAHNADVYTSNTDRILQDFQPNEDLLEIFKTDFQLRLLWGSRGAAVNQAERYEKFKLILTALSRKLEPCVKHTEL
uniref:BCAR3 adaptor protein, NSP family member n=1 Tax=Paramormyrops kingsleyae TaxID=1676925 RepID=A0A3B3RY43_9TELE|nr:breast cancer anti-estrogen resistance protein 3 isoform X1 [Paramormyrops kingsleyae]